MASKFLPFVNENTPIDEIFKALIRRSKGIPYKKICVVYSAILILGLDKVRQKADTLTIENPHSALLDLLADRYACYAATADEYSFWGFILQNYGTEKIKQSGDISVSQTKAMFTATVINAPERLENIGFSLSIDLFNAIGSGDKDLLLTALNPVVVSASGKRIGFSYLSELKAFVVFNIATNSEAIEVCPVFLNTEKKMPEGSCIYSVNLCASPYT
jgi:hypothetical protein